MAAVFAGAQKDIVRYGIQIQNDPLDPAEGTAADDETDAFARQADIVEQCGKVAGRVRKPPLLLDHEFGDGLLSSAHRPSQGTRILVFTTASGVFELARADLAQ